MAKVICRTVLVSLGLAGFAVSARAASTPISTGDQQAMVSPVIHPALVQAGPFAAPPHRIWVRFRDRGSAEGQQIPLSERSLRRRLLRGVALDTPERQPVAPEYIDAVRAAGGRIHRISRWLNGVSVDYDPDLVNRLAHLPAVSALLPVASFRAVPEPAAGPAEPVGASASSVLNYGPSAPQLQQIGVNLAHDRGYSGAGVLVAMFDTGFRKDHRAFDSIRAESRLVAEWDFVFNDGNVQNEPIDNPDAQSHGTATWSILGGTAPGQLYGPAYGASFLLAKTEDIRSETPVEEDNWVAALEWADSLGVDVVSSSLAYSDWYTLSDYNGLTAVTTLAANLAARLGIVVCNSAGNGGPGSRTIAAPVDGFYLISVGSVQSTGVISQFSSRGPTEDGRIKPEVCARGSSTTLASATDTNAFGTGSGTSFSCPLVGGCAALLLEAQPTWNPLMVREALMQTASDPATPDNTFGWGIVNVNAALDYRGSIQIQVLPHPDTLLSYEPAYDLQVQASSLSPVDLAGSSLYYRVDGGSYTAMPFAAGPTLSATLPAPQAYRSKIEYYIVVKDSVGFVKRLPESPEGAFTMIWQTLLVGDLNRNLMVEAADIVVLVNFVFKSAEPPDPAAAGEINGTSPVTSADIIYLVNYVFKSGPPPVFPGG